MQAAGLPLKREVIFRVWHSGRGSPDPSQGINSWFSTEALLNKSICLNIPSLLDKVLPHVNILIQILLQHWIRRAGCCLMQT